MDNTLNFPPFLSLIGILSDAIIVVDSNRIICAANEEVFLVFGYRSEELIGKELGILLPERSRKDHEVNVKNYFKDPEKRKMGKHKTVMGLRKDGTEFEIDVTLAPLEIDQKIYSIASCRDISDKKEREKELEEKNKILELINKELEKFDYVVSHDLNAPLSRISALTMMMMDEMKKINEISNNINESVMSMGEMIKGVLNHAIEGKVIREDQEFNVNELIGELQKLISIPSNFKVEINCDSFFIPGNKVQILQVFLNLLSNSIKYNDKKEGRIYLSCHDIGDSYKFQYSDNGRGIHSEIIVKIFDLFEKGNNKFEKNSYGIGLYTVKSIIEERGGKIRVESKVGEGTTFEFTWPKVKYG